jgi:hypothetical protein
MAPGANKEIEVDRLHLDLCGRQIKNQSANRSIFSTYGSISTILFTIWLSHEHLI